MYDPSSQACRGGLILWLDTYPGLVKIVGDFVLPGRWAFFRPETHTANGLNCSHLLNREESFIPVCTPYKIVGQPRIRVISQRRIRRLSTPVFCL
jgi:hypothetical protein